MNNGILWDSPKSQNPILSKSSPTRGHASTAVLADETLQCRIAAYAQRGGIGIKHCPCLCAHGRVQGHALSKHPLAARAFSFSAPAVLLFVHNLVPLHKITPNGAVIRAPPLGLHLTVRLISSLKTQTFKIHFTVMAKKFWGLFFSTCRLKKSPLQTLIVCNTKVRLLFETIKYKSR